MKEGQTWSMDVMIGTVVFVLGILIFFSVIEKNTDSGGLRELIVEAEKLASVIEASTIDSDNPCTFIIGNKLDKDRLAECGDNYNTTKLLLGTQSDFCIYFVDSQGNIMNLTNITGHRGIGIGDPKITYSIYDENGDVVDIIKCGSNLTVGG